MKTPLLTLYLLVTITCAKSLEDCVLRFEDNGVCACSSHDKAGLVKCHNYSSSSIEVQPCYCMYYDPALNLSTLGHCYFSCHQPGDIHIQINNSAEFNEDICDKYGFLHRTGRFCDFILFVFFFPWPRSSKGLRMGRQFFKNVDFSVTYPLKGV